jgi:hypothetical protein
MAKRKRQTEDNMVRVMVMSGESWDRMKAIIQKHPDVYAELQNGDFFVTEYHVSTVDELVNSDGKVIASMPRTEISIPLPIK